MSSVKLDPVHELSLLQEQMSRTMDVSRERLGGLEDVDLEWLPQCDIYEDEHSVVVLMDLPGVPLEDIDVQIEGQALLVQAVVGGEEEPGRTYHQLERQGGFFRRSFFMPETVDSKRIKASCNLGVLKVELPKVKAEGVRTVTIESSG